MNYLDKNNIPAGYKYSAVGIIPQEWEVKRLGTCFSIGHGRDYKYLSNGDIPVYGSGGIICYVGSFLHDGETVCIGRKGTINKPFYYNGPIWTIDTLFYTHSFQSVLPRYVGYLFDSIDWMRYNEATGVPSLTAKTISNIKKAVPPLAEQRKIAEILGVWDEAIEKQSRLIEKLELRKRGLMQRLLTGRTRLPGFTAPWQKVKLGEICEEYVLRNTEDNDYMVLSCTKYNGLVSSLDYFGKQIFSDNLRTYKVVPKYHFAYATNHIEEGSIGYQECYDYALISPMYTVFKADDTKVDNYFLYTLLKTPLMIYNYQSRIEGSIDRRGGLRWNAFAGITIKLPYLPEQTVIAEVLKAADKEIATHRKKLDALRLQKRGLMQQLLTGKTRVKI